MPWHLTDRTIVAALLVVAGLLVTTGPAPFAVALALGVLLAVAIRPFLGVLLSLSVALTYGVYVARTGGGAFLIGKDVLVGAIAVGVAIRWSDRRPTSFPTAPFGILLATALTSVALGRSTDLGTTVGGLRILFEWVIFGYVASLVIDDRRLRALLLIVSPLVVINALLAIQQSRVGAVALTREGYEYGSIVRQIGGTVRAFGMMPYGIPFGHSMALLAIACLAFVVRSSRRDVILFGSIGLLAVANLILSVNRTALLGLAVASIVVLWSSGHLAIRKMSTAHLVGGVVLVVLLTLVGPGRQLIGGVVQGAGNTSVKTRLDTWGGVSLDHVLFGDGPGTAGAAAVGRQIGGVTPRYAVVDNQYLSILLQLGVVGLAAFALSVTVLVRRTLRLARRPDASTASIIGLATLAYFVVAMASLNVWEDYPTVVLVWLFVGAGLGGTPRIASSEAGASYAKATTS